MNEESTSVKPDTTAEQDLHSKSQRQINRTWENTQAAVALIVIVTTSTGVLIGRFMADILPLPAEWWTIVGLVVGFYFGRTNHARMGG